MRPARSSKPDSASQEDPDADEACHGQPEGSPLRSIFRHIADPPRSTCRPGRTAIFAIAFACSWPGSEALGQDASAERAPAVRAETIAIEDQRVRPAEIYQDTPVETEIIDEEKLLDIPAVNPLEALEAIPGIRITPQVQGQRGAVRIDGLPPEFTELLVNGQRYAGENDRAIDLGDQLFANLDRIEILRGPQSLRYTARAAGGVINLITKDPPKDGPTVSTLVANGDQDIVSGEMTVGYGNPTLGGNFVYDYNQTGGFETPHPESTDFDDGLASPFGEGSLYRTHDLYSTLLATPTDNLELTTRLGYRIRDDAFAIGDGPITSRREDQRWLFSQQGDLEVGAATSLHGTITYSNNHLDSTVGRTYEFSDSLTRLELRGEHMLELGPTTHIFTVGTDLSSPQIELEEGDVPDNIDLDPQQVDERVYRGGVYGIVESEFSGWLSSEIGIRREHHSRFFPAWLPQAAILFTPYRFDEERAVKLRLSAGRAIRHPALRELYQPPTPQIGGAYFLAGSRDLTPEKAWAMRASIETNPVRWLSTTLTGFYSITSDYIRASDSGRSIQVGEEVIPANPTLCLLGIVIWCSDRVVPVTSTVYANANLDDLRSYGIEVRLELRPHELVNFELGYTWNRSLVDDSNLSIDELPNSPEHIANGLITLRVPCIDTKLTARGQWRSRAIIERSGTGLGSFATNQRSNTSFELDMRLRQPLERWLHHDVDLFADVQNVTDNRVIDSYVVRGRAFLIGIRATFP
ncbi:TonB-dependent receptor [Myxococcota bacterium]|nr:TonB-dependent receptor [Myxococcota bacterium]